MVRLVRGVVGLAGSRGRAYAQAGDDASRACRAITRGGRESVCARASAARGDGARADREDRRAETARPGPAADRARIRAYRTVRTPRAERPWIPLGRGH